MRNRTGNGSLLSLTLVIALAMACGGLGQGANAQCETKIIPPDGASYDYFGTSVSTDDDVMVVGADGDDDNGDYAGSVYVYRYDENESGWIEEAKLLASDSSIYFGTSVSVNGDAIVVGVSGDDDNGSYSGSAYVYRYDGSGWIEETKLLASDGDYGDMFGISVSIDGDAACVGAWRDGDYTGSAYVYRYDGSEWIEETKLLASDGDYGDLFGRSASIDGDVMVVGACNDGDNGTDSGSAYVYRYDGSGWTEEAKLLPSDGRSDAWFGQSVSIDGDVIVVGAWSDNDSGVWSGSAYVYRYDGYGWVEDAKLLASDRGFGDEFGWSVSIYGDVIVVGAGGDSDNGDHSGSAYVYRYDGFGWTEETKLLAYDGAAWDWFGSSVSLGSYAIVVGASNDDDNGAWSGSVYVCESDYDPNPTLTVSPNPLLAGQDATFSGTNLNPNTQTFLAYSLRGLGSTYIPSLNVTLDLHQPAQAGEMIWSDGGGIAQWVLYVPNAGAGRNVWFQACQYELTTNVVATSIE